MILYMLANAVFRTNMLISFLFLEAPFETTGLGISTKSMSLLSFFSFFPSIFLIFFSPLFVNEVITDKKFLKGVVMIYIVATMLIPTLRDILLKFGYDKNVWLVYFNEMIICCASPSLMSPYFYYYVVKKTPKIYRTAVNSAIFFTITILNSILVVLCSHMYSFTVNTEFFQQFAPFNKYIPFGFFACLDLIGYFSLK